MARSFSRTREIRTSGMLGGGEEPGAELLDGNSVTAPPCYPVAAARAAEADRHLVADEPAATSDEDGWPARETRALLLVAAGGRTPDADSVRGDPATAYGAVGASGVEEALVAANSVGHRAGGGGGVREISGSAAILGVRGLGRTRTSFRGGPPGRIRAKNRAGLVRRKEFRNQSGNLSLVPLLFSLAGPNAGEFCSQGGLFRCMRGGDDDPCQFQLSLSRLNF